MQSHYPEMVVVSWPTPFWIDRLIDHHAMRKRIIEGLHRIQRASVDFIAIPANLPHLYLSELRAAIHTPLLNLIDAAVDDLPSQEGPVALVATRPIRDSGIYQRALAGRNVQTHADEEMQQIIDQILGDLWAGHERAALEDRWRELGRTLGKRGATAVLLACTDFNAIATPDTTAPRLIDATRAMARKVVGAWHDLVLERGLNPLEQSQSWGASQ